MLLLLTMAKAKQVWHHDFEAHCAGLPPQQRTRTHRAQIDAEGHIRRSARTEHYYVQPKAAPSTAKDLMTDLVFMALRELERSSRARRDAFDLRGPVAPFEAPSIAVNCKQLGQRRSMSGRTVRTHLNLLLKLGALVRKVWHGTRANFELWINPKYLWQTPENAGENAGESDVDSPRTASILADKTTKFPLSLAFETLETLKLESSQVDKFLPNEVRSPVLATRATSTRNTGPQAGAEPAGAEPAGEASAKASTGPRHPSRARARQKNRAAPQTPPTGPTRARQKQFVMELWAYARPRLYANCAFDEQQHAKAQNAIWSGVYGAFRAPFSEQEWVRYHQEALERVDLVTAWLKRDSSRWIPAPYAEIVPGRGYFDHDNTVNGFVKVREWLAQKRRKCHEYRVAKTLKRAKAEQRGWWSKRAPRHVLALTASELYHRHLKEVQALRDPGAVEHFRRISCGDKS